MSDLISRKALQREIKNLYDLNYGEILIDPREFYEMVDCQETIHVDKKWIPVSEKLPEDEKYYNVTIKSTTKNPVEYCFYDKSKGKFYIVADGDEELNQVWEEEAKNVIAWQPLPPEYKEVSE